MPRGAVSSGMHWLADLRHALRLLGRSPLFTITSVLSLAAGLAVPSAVMSLADALLAPASGVRDADRLVDIGRSTNGGGFDNMTHPAFEYLRAHATTFDGMAAVDFGGRPMSYTSSGTSERVFGTLVSASFFDVLGAPMALGRGFRADEDVTPGARPVAVLTHRFWTERLRADPTAVGRSLRLNAHDFTVVGVAAPGFEGASLAGTDLWVPLAMVAEARGLANANLLTSARATWHVALGRLKPGVTRETADAELRTLMAQYVAATPDANPRHSASLVPTSRVPGPMRRPFFAFLGVLFALALALLAIAASNVAGLLLARASARRREMATRLALGAGRGRLVQQLLVETGVLFVAGALLALPLTMAAIGLLQQSLPPLPVVLNLAPAVSLRVVGFTLGLSLLSAVVFGLAPARHALGADIAPLLHGGTSTPDRRRGRRRQALVVVEVALSLMLVVTAGLFARTLQQAAAIDPGFTTRDIVLANVDVSLSGYRDAAAVAVVDRLATHLAALPGVTSVAAARMVPLQGSGFGLGELRVPGYRSAQGDEHVDADWDVVTAGYFATIGMRLVEGRGFTGAERADGPHVAIVNETFAARAWPGRPAVGQRLLHRAGDGPETPIEVVAVAADAKYRYVSDEPRPFIYVPLAQHPMGDVTFFVRHQPDASPAGALRAAIADVDATVPAMFVQSFDEAAGIGLTPQRVTAWIAASVGSTGLVLAAFGLYGLMAFLVTARTRDLAIRLSLGATPAQVGGIVVRQAALLGGAGAVVGLALAAGIGTLLESLLVGVPVVDLPSYSGAVALFLAVLTAASWLPARRAAATDPATALRAE